MTLEPVVLLSALEHHLYCPRQCALIHVDGLWAENASQWPGPALTAESTPPRGDVNGVGWSFEASPSIRSAMGSPAEPMLSR